MSLHSLARAGAALALTACLASQALAQTPGLLKLVVPFPAGGTADVLPRILSEKLRAQYPAGVVVENRAGAGGNIGAESVFRSEPDGLTLLASPPGPIAINHHLFIHPGAAGVADIILQCLVTGHPLAFDQATGHQ